MLVDVPCCSLVTNVVVVVVANVAKIVIDLEKIDLLLAENVVDLYVNVMAQPVVLYVLKG